MCDSAGGLIHRCDLLPQYVHLKDELDDAIGRVLRSGRYTLGEEVAAFEAEFAAYLDVPHVVAVADGTRALTLALRAVGVGTGDEVITTPFTAIPTIGAIVDAGATPVFVDIRPDTFLMDIEQAARAVTPRTRAIVPVHIFGNVVDIPALRAAVGPSIAIVEDAAQAHGSRLRGVHAGTMGDLGIFSFYPTKNLGAMGDGGAVVGRASALADTLRLIRNHGLVDKDSCAVFGVNSRLDELQAAILRVKLRHLDAMNGARVRIAQRYRDALPARMFAHQQIERGVTPNYHIFQSLYAGDRAGLVRHLAAHGIQTNIYYVTPHHLQPAAKGLGYKAGDFPNVEGVCARGIALPMYAELGAEAVDAVIEAAGTFAARDRVAPAPNAV